MNSFCPSLKHDQMNVTYFKFKENIVCISNICIFPLVSSLIIIIFFVNEWKIYQNKISKQYGAPFYVRRLAFFSCTLNLLAAIFEIPYQLYISNIDVGTAVYIKISFYIFLSLLILTSCENYSLLVDWNFRHILIWILFIVYIGIEITETYYFGDWRITGCIHLLLKTPFLLTYIWTVYKICRKSTVTYTPIALNSADSRLDERSEYQNIFSILSCTFFSWGIHIFSSKCDITDIDNLVSLPKALQITNIENKFEQLFPFSKYKFSAYKLVMKAYGWKYLLIGVLCFVSDVLTYAQPFALENILNFISNKSQYHLSFGITWMAILIACSFASSLLKIHFDYQLGSLVLSVKSAFMLMIYKNILSARSYKMNYINSGNLVNLVGTDLDQFLGFGVSFHSSWSIIFQFSIALYLLYRQLGFSFFIGILFSIIMFPINYFIGLKIQRNTSGLMTRKDERLRILREIFFGILPIKVNNWIKTFTKVVKDIRDKEIQYLGSSKYLDAFCVVFWATSPSIVAALTLGLHVLLGNELTATQAFTSISIFYLLNFPINALSCSINGMMQANISAKRLQNFFQQLYTDENDYKNSKLKLDEDTNLSEEKLIFYDDASFCHNFINCNKSQLYKKVLQNISLSIYKKQLIAIVGVVASGKSSLLLSLIRELHVCSGIVKYQEPLIISYCPQTAWLFSGTIRDNILRGSSYIASRYEKIIDSCSLKNDLAKFQDGDLTNIGSRGILLSGGQKARICLAAAVYKKADIYLLDDILSAVDVNVADDIFNKCILGVLKKSARIITLNQHKYLDHFSNIFELNNSTLTERTLDTLQIDIDTVSNNSDLMKNELTPRVSSTNIRNSIVSNDFLPQKIENGVSLGYVSIYTYVNYFKLFKRSNIVSLLLSITLFTATKCVSDWWISYWVNYLSNNAYVVAWFPINLSINNFCLIIYSEITIFCILFAIARAITFVRGSLCASSSVHEKLLNVYLNLPLRFYEENDIGALLNAFSADIFAIDETVPFIANIFLAGIFNLLGTIITICITIPVFLPIAILFVPLIVYMQHIYRRTTNVLKRLNTAALSPILDSISECYDGSICIKLSTNKNWFISYHKKYVNDLQKTSYSLLYSGLFFRMVLQMISCFLQIFVLVSATLTIFLLNINQGVVCLGITYSLTISSNLLSLLSSFVETDKNMIHAERVLQKIESAQVEYSDPSTLLSISDGALVNGEIEFRNVMLTYPNGQIVYPLGISMKILPGQKIGICGATGCGKSSIMKLLFKVILPSSGEIFIDNINLSNISNEMMARSFFFVTQEAIIFSQTLRFNLDPNFEYTDDELWHVLNRTGLKSLFNENGLNTLMNSSELNLSAGQKQLLILCRGLLKRPKVICFDEATSNLDYKTEKIILGLVEEAFKESTIISIAHRVESITNTDFTFVFEEGRIIEYDRTSTLIEDEHSLFRKLLDKQKQN